MRVGQAEVSPGVVSRARRSVLLLSRTLVPVLFDNAGFCDAPANPTHASSHSHTRILAQQPNNILCYGHRLLHTLQRITNKIEVRQSAKQHRQIN